MSSSPRTSIRTRAVVGVALLALSGCSLAPREAAEEEQRMLAAGAPYEAAPAERLLPDLPPEPQWQDLLRHAFLANGELEAAYFAWRAAIERIDIAAGYPNTNVSVGFEYLFSGGNLTGWDRTALSVGFDPMQNLSFPTKVLAAGRVATEEAQAAGSRFAAAKFAVQRQVLDAYLDYALAAEMLRIQQDDQTLRGLAADTAAARVSGGRPQQDLLDAEVERQHGEHLLLDVEAALPQLRARLNALIGRHTDAPLPPPPALPAARPLPPDDAALLAAGTRANPELAALAHDAAGRDDALDLARQQYFPDINPFAGFQGSMEQAIGAAITLPTKIPQIMAGIREARANLRASDALARQGALDRDAAFVAALLALRASERQLALLERHVVPSATAAAGAAELTYATGGGDLTTVIEARRTLLELRLAIAETRVARERRVAELEQLAGVDAERLAAEGEDLSDRPRQGAALHGGSRPRQGAALHGGSRPRQGAALEDS
jgi:outer membrane protein TolC